MIYDSVYFKGYRCFQDDWAGFRSIKPVNVIIGRNNTGKSHLLDLIENVCTGKKGGSEWQYRFSGILEKPALEGFFPKHMSGGDLGGNYWDNHGQHFVGIKVEWNTDGDFHATNPTFSGNADFDHHSNFGNDSTAERISTIEQVLSRERHPLYGSSFKRLHADRDIRPEKDQAQLQLSADGAGASNIIRRYIVTSNPRYPREVVQSDLLKALNDIFSPDGYFSEIQIKVHDESKAGGPEGTWEIFLGEDKKGLVPLSNSGSGLKTVFLVLLNLLVVPHIESRQRSNYTFAFEELENNLHPSLLRRLLQYIEKYAIEEESKVFLTTHSSAALDLFGTSENAQIVHVLHDGESARTVPVGTHFEHVEVLSQLGAKPSDILQANGIIWVEGPSDRVYINRWIDLCSNGGFKEGREYQCAFYGGALLARTQFVAPEEADKDLVNLLRLNPNIVVLCDGDRKAKSTAPKARVIRIKNEVRKISLAHIWITDAREIENYIPGKILGIAFDRENARDPEKYESFFPTKSGRGASYVEKVLKQKVVDKMELAGRVTPAMTLQEMELRFEWKSQMQKLLERIKAWNE